MTAIINSFMEFLYGIFYDLICYCIILSGIKIVYMKCYSQTACKYMGNQFNLLLSSIIVTSITLRTYYTITTIAHFEDTYDILLSVFLVVGGWTINTVYRHICDRTGKYIPTDGEYRVVVVASVLGVGIKMFADGVVELNVPILLIMGRLSGWLDTKNPKEIIQEYQIRHNRLKESLILATLGIIIISVILKTSNCTISSYILQNIVAVLYFVILVGPYSWLKTRRIKKLESQQTRRY